MSDAVTALQALREITREWCGEWDSDTMNRCGKQAEFVLWGKLIPPEGLGPRCYDCAAKHIDHYGLAPNSGYALIDLRLALAALESSAASTPDAQAERPSPGEVAAGTTSEGGARERLRRQR